MFGDKVRHECRECSYYSVGEYGIGEECRRPKHSAVACQGADLVCQDSQVRASYNRYMFEVERLAWPA